jgi:hypothetical protein
MKKFLNQINIEFSEIYSKKISIEKNFKFSKEEIEKIVGNCQMFILEEKDFDFFLNLDFKEILSKTEYLEIIENFFKNLCNEKIYTIFEFLDSDRDGFIDKNDIIDMMGNYFINEESIEMIKEVDFKNSKLDFENFFKGLQ